MGKELEYKLWVPDAATLERILADEEIAQLSAGAWRSTEMKTTYFDCADRRFAQRKWTLRRRMEGEKSIVCLKTPQNEAHLRGEWQIEADAFYLCAVEQLIALGAPELLRTLLGNETLSPVCGAEFLRRSVMLTFFDGSSAELAGDHGILRSAAKRLPFTELELELYSGSPEAMRALAERLCTRYQLHEEPLSKAARAQQLDSCAISIS